MAVGNTIIRESVSHVIIDDGIDATTVVDRSVVETLISTLVGPAGTAAAEYVHIQSVPSDTWTINHDVSSDTPSVIVIDSADDLVFGGVNYVTSTQVVVTFSGAFAGKARLL